MSTKNLHSKHKFQGKNLRVAIKSLGIPAIEAADKIGISRSLISGLMTGKKALQKYHLLLFESILGLNKEFIESGTGPHLLSEQIEEPATSYEKSENRQLYKELLKAKDVIIQKQEALIKSLEADKKHMQGMLDKTVGEIERLKKEVAALGESSNSA